MEWEEEFPFPGEYTFKGQCDNKASFYLDGQQLISDIAKWKDKPSVIKKNLDWEDSDKKGKVYKMRLDLLNLPILKEVTIQSPDPSKSAGVSGGIKVQKVFNTVDWMGKANRQLWRTNVVNRGGFINSAGVCPFDTNIELDTNPYAGTHGITWRNVNFPIDGNYIIKVAVDDNVNLRFHGSSGDISIRKEGFINNDGSLPTGTSTYTKFFKKGMYTLDADLEQIPGGRFGFRSDSKVIR